MAVVLTGQVEIKIDGQVFSGGVDYAASFDQTVHVQHVARTPAVFTCKITRSKSLRRWLRRTRYREALEERFWARRQIHPNRDARQHRSWSRFREGSLVQLRAHLAELRQRTGAR